jgi:hypothetical protein
MRPAVGLLVDLNSRLVDNIIALSFSIGSHGVVRILRFFSIA